MPKRSRGQQACSKWSEGGEPLWKADMLLLFSAGLNWETYNMCKPLPTEVLAIIVEYALDPLELVRERRRAGLYDSGDGVNAKWLIRFMDLTRRPSDAPYGEAFDRCGTSMRDRVRKGDVMRPGTMDMYDFFTNSTPKFPHGNTNWSAKQWKWFLVNRLETCMKRPNLTNHIRNIYDHSTRYYVAGYGRSYRHQFVLYEPYAQTQPEFDAVESHLRMVLGSPNFDRFVRLRLFPSGMQVFFFGPAVDIDTVMQSALFKEHSYFEGLKDTGNTSLLKWQRWSDGTSLRWDPAPLAAEGGRRALRICFK